MPTSCWNTDSATPTSTTRAPKASSGAGFSSSLARGRELFERVLHFLGFRRARQDFRAFVDAAGLYQPARDSGTEKLR